MSPGSHFKGLIEKTYGLYSTVSHRAPVAEYRLVFTVTHLSPSLSPGSDLRRLAGVCETP